MPARCTVAERNIGIGVVLLCIAGLYVIAARDASTSAGLHEHSATTATAVRGGGSPQAVDPGRRRRVVSGQVLCWPLAGDNVVASTKDSDPPGVPLTRETLVDALWPRAPVIEADPLKTEGFGPQQLHWKTKREATSTAAAYPLTLEQFERSFLPPGDACNWQRMLDALDDGRRLRLVVLGGSMTHGIGCARDALAPICAWYNELRAWLAAIRPHWKLEVVGQGFGGQHAGDLARSTAVQPADIYVVDTLVNSIQVYPVDVPNVYDALMWRLLHHAEAPNMGGQPAVLSVQSMPAPERLETADSEARVAQHYGLPVASYRLAVFPGLVATPLPPGYTDYLWVDPEKRGRGEVYGTHPTKSESRGCVMALAPRVPLLAATAVRAALRCVITSYPSARPRCPRSRPRARVGHRQVRLPAADVQPHARDDANRRALRRRVRGQAAGDWHGHDRRGVRLAEGWANGGVVAGRRYCCRG